MVLYCFCIAYSLYILWKIVYSISGLPYYAVSFLGAGTPILFISQLPVPSTEPGTQIITERWEVSGSLKPSTADIGTKI